MLNVQNGGLDLSTPRMWRQRKTLPPSTPKRTVVADTALTLRCTSSTSAPENFLAKMSSTKLSSSVHGPLHICFSVLFCGSTYSACLRICLIYAVRRILLLFPGVGSSGSYLLLRDRHLKYHLRVARELRPPSFFFKFFFHQRPIFLKPKIFHLDLSN